METSGWKQENYDHLHEMISTIIHIRVKANHMQNVQLQNYTLFLQILSSLQSQQDKIQKGAGLQADGMLFEVGNNGNAFCYAASWVLEFLLGGPPRLRSDAGVWSVSLNDNSPSSPAAGQEEEEVFLPESVETDTLQT